MNGDATSPDIPEKMLDRLEKFADRGFEYLLAGGGFILIIYGLFGSTTAGISGNELLVLLGLGGVFITTGFLAFFVKQRVKLQTREQDFLLNQLREMGLTTRRELGVIQKSLEVMEEAILAGKQEPREPSGPDD